MSLCFSQFVMLVGRKNKLPIDKGVDPCQPPSLYWEGGGPDPACHEGISSVSVMRTSMIAVVPRLQNPWAATSPRSAGGAPAAAWLF